MAVLKYFKNEKWLPTITMSVSETEVASYDISGDAPEDNVQLSISTSGDGLYLANVKGTGGTKSFAVYDEEGKWVDTRPWQEYIPNITSIVISKEITSIGDYLFNEHQSVTSLKFENSANITHLGNRAFRRCAFDGEFSFPSLKDNTFEDSFSFCVNLKGLTLSDSVQTLLGPTSCLSLEYIHGINKVKTIANGAFLYTPKLASLDIDPNICTSIGTGAFTLSGDAMRYATQQQWPNTAFGLDATPEQSYGADKLNQIRNVQLSNVPAREVYADAIWKYDDIKYCVGVDANGKTYYRTMGDSGCKAFSQYYMFNWRNGAPYGNFRDWWECEILKKYVPHELNEDGSPKQIYDYDIGGVTEEIAKTLGWSWTPIGVFSEFDNDIWPGKPAIYDTTDKPKYGALAKKIIKDDLENGYALMVGFWHATNTNSRYDYYGHAVTIIGSDANADKLIIADGTKTIGDRGIIFEVSFEQLFTGDIRTLLYSMNPEVRLKEFLEEENNGSN